MPPIIPNFRGSIPLLIREGLYYASSDRNLFGSRADYNYGESFYQSASPYCFDTLQLISSTQYNLQQLIFIDTKIFS